MSLIGAPGRPAHARAVPAGAPRGRRSHLGKSGPLSFEDESGLTAVALPRSVEQALHMRWPRTWSVRRLVEDVPLWPVSNGLGHANINQMSNCSSLRASGARSWRMIQSTRGRSSRSSSTGESASVRIERGRCEMMGEGTLRGLFSRELFPSVWRPQRVILGLFRRNCGARCGARHETRTEAHSFRPKAFLPSPARRGRFARLFFRLVCNYNLQSSKVPSNK